MQPTMDTIHATQESGKLIRKMTDDLGFWAHPGDAALFLAALALARGEAPVPTDELSSEPEPVAELSEIDQGPGHTEHLALVGLLQDDHGQALGTPDQDDLVGLIEAGARLLEPRLAGTDAAGAAAELSELLAEVKTPS